MDKKNFISDIVIVLAAVALFFVVASFWGKSMPAHSAQASASDALSGYAWSETIGWISFNCTTDPGGCVSSNYGVNVDTNGNFSGYAWSENVGWISFNSADLSGCPHAPCTATYNFSTNQAQGWARALAGNSSASPGWDGWISLNCATDGVGCTTSNYAVSYNNSAQQFQGWAWGSDVVGWVSFNCTTGGSSGGNICSTSQYAVGGTLNTPPTASNLVADPPSSLTYCGGAHQHFSWAFSDPQDGSTQTAYQLQVSNDSAFTSIQYDSGKQTSPSKEYFVPVSITPVVNTSIGFNKNYYWRVQVFDKANLSSGWVNYTNANSNPLNTFPTPVHPWPSSAFTYIPSSPSVNETTTFSATSPNGYGTTAPTFTWSFTHATPSTGTGSTAQTKFTQSGPSNSATLTATDDAGTCTTQQSFNIKPPLPQFKEVQP